MGFIMIYVTCKNMTEAKKICVNLLQNKMISSANYFPIKSISNWTGKIQEVNEVLIILKTKKENWEKVRDNIKNIHPYKIPCITKISAEANEDYEKWINNEVK